MAQDREQDRTDCKQPSAPLLCANNCGFVGCPATMNLCSKCYKTLVLKEESKRPVKALGEKKLAALSERTLAKEAISAITSSIHPEEGDLVSASSAIISISGIEPESSISTACSVNVVEHSELLESTLTEQEGPTPLSQPAHAVAPQRPSTGSTRCLSCRRRVGLLGFKCRCGGLFCSSHRYSDKHDCTYDYKAAARDAIAKANPVVKAEKVEKI